MACSLGKVFLGSLKVIKGSRGQLVILKNYVKETILEEAVVGVINIVGRY